MAFNFGAPSSTPKPATGFTLPTATPATTGAPLLATPAGGGFQFNLSSNAASGDAGKPQQPSFGTPVKPPTATTGFGFNAAASSTPAGNFSFGGAPAVTSAQPNTGLNLVTTSKAAATSAPTLSFGFGAAPTTTTASGTATSGFTPILGGGSTTMASSGVSAAPSTTGLTFGTSVATSTVAPKLTLSTTASTLSSTTTTGTTPSTLTTTSTPSSFALTGTLQSNIAPTQTTSSAASISATGSLTFAQLEDSINKWTMDLDEQSKFFINQAKQLNAWDSLLISNGEKILNLNTSIEGVKQQQGQLDQELDFILAQQKELHELIVPLEKDLSDTPVTDVDRNQMYQCSEIIDSQLKQISEDLKEIVENINDSNEPEEVSNPIIQISKILSTHMDSLQWIDRNSALISAQLEEISKLEDTTKRNFNNSMSSFNNSLF